MAFVKQSFRKSEQEDFLAKLKLRVDTYFATSHKSRYGDSSMYVKTLAMFALYFTPYFCMLSGIITDPLIIVGCYLLMGVGMLGIGLSIMHDANHGSYSRKRWVNKYLSYTMNLIGGNAEIWKLQHNVLHHTFTNIPGTDDDIKVPPILRFTPYDKKYKFHKLQFLYAWLLYGFTTLARTSGREFVLLADYRNRGLINGRRKFRRMLLQLIGWKLFYYTFMFILPLVFIPAPAWVIILSYVIMHFFTGLMMSSIFQLAHMVPECKFPTASPKGEIETSWVLHELETTSNFAPRSSVLTWFIGGLNFQVEHHLFPNICHIHYKKLSSILKATTSEFGLPYHSQKNFITALVNHTKMLYQMGRCAQEHLAV